MIAKVKNCQTRIDDDKQVPKNDPTIQFSSGACVVQQERTAMKPIILATCLTATLVIPAAASERIAFSPDGKRMAVGWDDGRIEIRDGATGDLRASFLHEGVPNFDPASSAVNWTPTFAFSPDGKTLASACGYAPVMLWDAEDGGKIRALPGRSVGYDLTFSSDGSRIIGIGVDSKVGPHRLTLWDVQAGRRLRDLTIEMKLGKEWNRYCFKTVRFAQSGPMLVIETYEGQRHFIRVWNAQTGEETMKIASDAGYPPSWVLSPDGNTLVTRSYSSGKHTMWETDTGKAKKTWDKSMDVNNK